jgi:outer membrane protein assembly factor BamB
MLSMLAVVIAAVAQATAPLTTLYPQWTVTLDSPAAAPAAYDLHTAYVPLRDGSLIAVGLDRGLVRWERDLSTTVTPATGGGMVFVASNGSVEALTADGGETRWRAPVPGRVTSLAWDTGWLICGTDSGDMAALRAADGTFVWRASLGASMIVAPAAALDRLYLALEGGRVVALGLATGQQAWEHTVEGRISALASTAGQLVVGTNRAVVSLDPTTGRQRWRWRAGGDASGPATSDDRHIYFASRDNVVRAVDRNNGNLKWYAELTSRPVGGPSLFDGTVLMPISTAVEVFDPSTGKLVGTIAVAGEVSSAPHLRIEARPTAARLIATTREGRMQGFGVNFEPPLRPLEALPGAPVVP